MQIHSNQQNINSNQNFGAYIVVRNLNHTKNASTVVKALEDFAESYAPKAKENGGEFFTGVCKELPLDENHTIIDKFVISTGDDAMRSEAAAKEINVPLVQGIIDILEKHKVSLENLFNLQQDGIGSLVKHSDGATSIDLGRNYQLHNFKLQPDGLYVSEKL